MPPEPNRPVHVTLSSIAAHAEETIRRAPNEVIITSPYLTSGTAEAVIGAANPGTCIILTTFRAETFANKASSLSTMRKLIFRGFQLRYLEDLHAKIVATSGTFFIGSQNLTFAGTQNKEATAIIGADVASTGVADCLSAWVKASLPITKEMIDEMEKFIKPLAEQFTQLSKTASTIDEHIRSAEERRERVRIQLQARQEQLEQQRKRMELLHRVREAHSPLQSRVREAPADWQEPLRLQEIDTINTSIFSRFTLMARPNADLTYGWLTKRERYLLIAPEIGKLGWPALNKTRLTKFGTGLTPSESFVTVQGDEWKVTEISLNDDLESLERWNVRFALKPPEAPSSVEVLMKFTLEGLHFVAISERRGYLSSANLEPIFSSPNGPSRALCKELMSPF
jgi:PLD-like domain